MSLISRILLEEAVRMEHTIVSQQALSSGTHTIQRWQVYIWALHTVTAEIIIWIIVRFFYLTHLTICHVFRITDSLMKVFLWILKKGGAGDVPSFDHLRKVQKRLHKSCGVQSKECKSMQGNVFYINDSRDIIAQVCLLFIFLWFTLADFFYLHRTGLIHWFKSTSMFTQN